MELKRKKTYMVEFSIPSPINEEFIKLVPIQRAQVHRLMLNGSIISYTLSADRTKLWSVVAAESRDVVDHILDQLPLSPWMRADIHELTFHGEAQTWRLPALSLN